LYVNVPAVENVWLNFPPGAIDPELNDPLSPVAVCVVESLFVQVTVPPTEIETGFGEYAVSLKLDEPLTMETGVPVVTTDGADGELDPHPTANPINPASTLNRNFICLSIRTAHRKGVATSAERNCSYSAEKMRRPPLDCFRNSKSFLPA
jgi:hypothetical protein